MFSYSKYLAAKEPIDERSLNRNVWDAFGNTLKTWETDKLNIIEIGGGIGSTFKRIASLHLQKNLVYTLLDIEEENIDYFRNHIYGWLDGLGYQQRSAGSPIWANAAGYRLEIVMVLGDVQHFIKSEKVARHWDVVIAQAFLDLFDLKSFLPNLLTLLKTGGVFYFPINFDGITSFLPPINPSVDQLVESIYHNSMDARALQPVLKGRSQSGRHLLTEMLKLNLNIIEAGSSDWIVYPKDGRYEREDASFLHQILQFVKGELEKSNEIDRNVADEWLVTRMNQLEKGELIYMAHQIDLLGALN